MARGMSLSFQGRTRSADHSMQANVMLSYPIAEAEELLVAKLKAAKDNLSNCEEDLDFLREQITVSLWDCLNDRLVIDNFYRLWRLLQRESITGM